MSCTRSVDAEWSARVRVRSTATPDFVSATKPSDVCSPNSPALWWVGIGRIIETAPASMSAASTTTTMSTRRNILLRAGCAAIPFALTLDKPAASLDRCLRPAGSGPAYTLNSDEPLNVAADPTTEVAQKGVLYFKEVAEGSEEDHLRVVEELSASPTVVRYNTRFVIVTDYVPLLAKDIKTGDTLVIPIREIADHFTFFLPWAGKEKAQYTAEAHADVKAAERMAKLFDELIKLNPEANQTQLGRHSLNIFFTRLLFCFFAEDTGIFTEGQFTGAIESLTQPDGSDLHYFLTDLFVALDTERAEYKKSYVAGFTYVNGHLFTVKPDQTVPVFNKKARDYLLESGKLDWSEINPDIFGSMFQAIVTPGQRSDLGQYYTSVPNILIFARRVRRERR